MKYSKKFLSMTLAVAMLACMGMTTFATGANPTGETIGMGDSQKIPVQLEAGLKDEAAVYSVNVSWTSMDFTYLYQPPVWDPATHTRSAASGSWNNDGEGTITVINHSNKPVSVSNSFLPTQSGQYENGREYNGVTVMLGLFKNYQLQAGVPGNPAGTDGVDMTTCKLTVEGTPAESIPKADVGTITVTISTVAH